MENIDFDRLITLGARAFTLVVAVVALIASLAIVASFFV